MNKIVLTALLLAGCISVDAQRGVVRPATEPGTDNFSGMSAGYRPYLAPLTTLSFLFGNRVGVQPEVLYSGRLGGGGTVGFFRPGHFSTPLKFNYQLAKGVNIHVGSQLGGLGGRQAKVGASFLLSSGVNLTAGYGASLMNFNRPGFNMPSRNQGLQITAGYRLFKKMK